MTSYPNTAFRAIARSRGHLRQAEEAIQDERNLSSRFSVAKANHAVQVGILQEQFRIAEAAEIRTIIEVLKMDPEVLEMSDTTAHMLEDRVILWAEGTLKDKTEEVDG